jgi:hypothetical protein
MQECHPEPIRFAQGKLREGSRSGERSFAALRMTKRESLLGAVWRRDACVAPCRPPARSCAWPPSHSSCLCVAHCRAWATQASPRLVHTAPAPTRRPWAHRLLKRPHHKHTPERASPVPAIHGPGELIGSLAVFPRKKWDHLPDSCSTRGADASIRRSKVI